MLRTSSPVSAGELSFQITAFLQHFLKKIFPLEKKYSNIRFYF